MNKVFLRGLVVAAVLLINCTLLSGFIERQMTVPVRECSPRYDNAVGSQRIPADAIRWEDGQSFLYAIQEGQGLTAGLWAKRVPVNVMGIEGTAAFVMEDESQEYVLYGSRPFQDGERVLPVEEGQAQPDTLLLWMPAGASPLEQGVTIPLGEGEATLYSREVTQPFLAERELAQLVPEELRAQSAVISCQELEKLLNGLPWLAGAALLMLATLLLAILFCAALGRGKRWPWYLGCGVGCFLAWVGLVLVLGRTQLPSSLLPTGNIFAWGHYSNLFRLAEEGLAAFAENARCAELLNLLGQRQREAMLLLAGGAALLCLLLVTVGMYLRRSSGFHARGGRLPSFRKEESEKS